MNLREILLQALKDFIQSEETEHAEKLHAVTFLHKLNKTSESEDPPIGPGGN